MASVGGFSSLDVSLDSMVIYFEASLVVFVGYCGGSELELLHSMVVVRGFRVVAGSCTVRTDVSYF